MSLAVKNIQDPSYLSRQDANLGALAAGSGGQTSKFVAFAALQLFGLTTYETVAGTSTYTNTVTGVGTSVINGQQVSLIVVVNTATAGAAAALSTSTYGPFNAGGTFAGGGTGTGQVGGINTFPLNTAAGTAGFGGIPVPLGAYFYCVSGTDATAVNVCTIDYQVQPGAGLTQ